MPTLSLNLLGSFGAHLEGHSIKNPGVKAQALLIHLAVEQRPQRREQLLTLLWPGMPEKSARHNLSQAIYALRKIFPEDIDVPLLLTDRQILQLNPAAGLVADIHQFDSFLTAAQSHTHPNLAACLTCHEALEQAVNLYRGDFISDFYLEDSNEFDEWAEAVREDYRSKLMEVLATLTDIAMLNGNHAGALTTIDRQLTIDNLDERAHRQKIKALALAGRRVEAIRQYRTFEQLLDEQLGISPSQETSALYRRIRAEDLAVSIPSAEAVFEKTAAPRHNLQPARTSFIGREEQISEVKALLPDHRLVTLIGPGGVGKSRLALQVAGQVLDNYPNGVWLVELAGLSDLGRVPKTVALALNLPEIPGKSVRAALVDFLVRKQLLLVLDNCEHLLEACSNLVDGLLNACPQLTILASSQEFLGVRGEIPYRVPPLALPNLDYKLPLTQLSEYESVRLFVARGRVVAPDFAITAGNAAATVQVVCRLDGLPLAIELAASRLRLLSVAQIAQRLDNAFRLLSGGSQGALPRHQTLRASLDWSYNLLTEPERTLLRRLSVFAGSWRLRAAEGVCAGRAGPPGNIREEEVLDLLSGLVDKSFVVPVNTVGGRNRYQMLETVRQYAHELLVENGEAQFVRDRHLAYYLEWVEEQAPKIRGPEQIRRLNQFERELDNLRLALEWGLQRDIQAELQVSTTLQWFWHIRSHEPEGLEWLSRGLEAAGEILAEENIPREENMPVGLRLAETPEGDIDPLVRAHAMVALGFLRWLQLWSATAVDYAPQQAKSLLESAISIYQAIGIGGDLEVRRDLAWAQLWLSHYMGDVEDDQEQARFLVQEALNTFRAIGDWLGEAECLQLLGDNSSDPDEARMLYQEQLAIHVNHQDPHGMGNAHQRSGTANSWNGDYETARRAYEASLICAWETNDPVKIVQGLNYLGFLHLHCGDLRRADECLQQALATAYELGIEGRIVDCLLSKSYLRMAQGRYEQAAEITAEALRIAQSTGVQPILANALKACIRLARLQGDTALVQKHVETLLNLNDIRPYQKTMIPLELGYLAIQQGDLAGARSQFQKIVQVQVELFWPIAPVLDGLALFVLKKGQMATAARLFGSRWCRGYTHLLSPAEKAWRQADCEAMQAELGEARFEQLYEAGKGMTIAEATDLAREIVSPDP